MNFINKITTWFNNYHDEDNETKTLWEAEKAVDVRDCLFLGDDIDASQNGCTPFVYHCRQGNIEVVLELIKQGCNLKEKNYNIRRGLYYICLNGHYNLLVEINKLVEYHESIFTHSHHLFYACIKCGNTDIFDFLLANGCNPHARDHIGSTVFMWACAYRQLDIIDRLLKLNIDINATDTNGNNALTLMIYSAVFTDARSDQENYEIAILHKLFLHGFTINTSTRNYASDALRQKKYFLATSLIDYGCKNPQTS